ncbi:MAG: LamG domain-containing protein [Candidatus Dojkabacteria bacterium]
MYVVPCPCDNSCSGTCTSTPPAGYGKTDPNNLCSTDTATSTCTYANDCGNTCSQTDTNYRLETNLAESIPSSLIMTIDGVQYDLSTSSTSPTTIKYPSTENNVTLTLPVVSDKPEVNRENGYMFRANNYGVSIDDTQVPEIPVGVAQWNFNETSGIIATNVGSCGASCNGTLTNMVTTGQDDGIGTGWTADYLRWGTGAVMFDGTNDQIVIPSTSLLSFSGDFAYASWIKTTSTSLMDYLYSSTAGSQLGVSCGLNYSTGGKARCSVWGNPDQITLESTSAVNNGLWHNIVFMRSGANYSLYIDGSLNTSRTDIIKDFSGTGNFYIGSSGSLRYFNGVMDSTSIYSRALSSSEILSLYQSGETINQTGDYEWDAWTDCSNPRPEDFCSEGTTETQDFDPSSLTMLQTLKEDAEGQIGGLYYTLNRCDNDKLYSPVLQTYYKVNSNPQIVPPGSESDCDMDADAACTIENIFPDVGGTDSTSSKGCKSTNYTGKEVNNPLRITLAGDDLNDDNEIKGAVVWFSKDNNIPKLPSIVSEYTYTNTEEMGVMILNDQVYGSNNDSTWALLNGNILKNSEGNDLARVLDVSKNSEDGKVTFDFKIEFFSNSTTNPEGIYGFHAVVLDSYMALADGRIDQSHMTRYFDWGIDLEDPVVTEFKEDIITPKTLTLSWDIDGTKSNIIDLVINGYRVEPGDDGIVGNITMTNPDKGEIVLSEGEIPPVEQIGLLSDTNTWQFNDLTVSNPYVSSGVVDIGVNELGAIAMYASAYDQACNFTNNTFNVNLEPWYATQGGSLYSKGYLGIGSKSTPSDIDTSIFRNFSAPLQMDQGTELLSARNQIIDNLLYPESKAVRASSIYDSNEKKNFWFTHLTRKLDVQKDTLKNITAVSQCASSEQCLLYSTGDVNIPQNSTCNGMVLVVSEGDISITPNLESGNDSSGCIFLAKGDILVKSGTYKSSVGNVRYDYIDGFLMAENKIEIEYADADKLVRDGLELRGGLVGLGRDLIRQPGVDIKRDLRLYNYSYPTLVVTHDPRYAKISETFFGTEVALYKQEIGFKAL